MRREPELDVGEADARAVAEAGIEHSLDGVTRDPPAVVTDGHAQAAATDARADKQVKRAIGLAVLDGVLDEWLHEQWRQANLERFGVGLDGDVELVAEPRLLEREVAPNVAELLIQRDELTGSREPRAQRIGEREDQLPCALRVGADERRDRIERVEDEVGLDLRLQCGGGRRLQLGKLELGRQLFAEVVERLNCRLVERRPGGRVRDDRPGRPVVEDERNDRRGAERAGGMSALGAQAEGREQRPRLRERLEDRPDRTLSCRVMVGARADEREHALGIRHRDRAVAELLEQLVGDGARRRLGEAPP